MISRPILRRYFSYVIIIVVSIILTSLFSGGMIKKISSEETEKYLLLSAQMLKHQINYLKPESIDEFTRKSGTEEIRITVIKIDGKVIGDSVVEISKLENHKNREEVREASAGETGIAIRKSVSINKELMYLALPPFDFQEEQIILRVSVEMKDLDAALMSNYLKIGTGAFIFFLFVTIITLFIEKKNIYPIAVLQKAAKEYGAGNLDHYFRIEKPDDLKTVAISMNKMADSLKKKIIDITNQRNQTEGILNTMAEGVILFDGDLTVRKINPAAKELLSLPDNDYKGKSIEEVVYNTQLITLARNTLKSGKRHHISIDFTYTSPGSPSKNLEVQASALKDGTRGILVIRDITRMKQLEQIRKDFITNVSHELKTPITAIKGSIETLRDISGSSDEKMNRFLDTALRQIDRLNIIINDLLQLSRLEDDSQNKYLFVNTPVREIIDTAIHACSAQMETKGIRIEIKEDTSLEISVDHFLMEQALINLIDNAVKYSPANSNIIIACTETPGKINLSITDQGPGIPERHLSRIFERFYRVDKARSRELGGTGLGLSIVKHIVSIHKGTIEVESSVGKGSTFTVSLPAGAGRFKS